MSVLCGNNIDEVVTFVRVACSQIRSPALDETEEGKTASRSASFLVPDVRMSSGIAACSTLAFITRIPPTITKAKHSRWKRVLRYRCFSNFDIAMLLTSNFESKQEK